jgi:hypothetical protein
MSSENLQTKKPHKLFGMIFSWWRTYEIINVSDIIICILFIFTQNFVDIAAYSMIFLIACIVFLLISTVTFFTYFYYRSFGTKMHYAYFFSAVIYCLVCIAMTLVSIVKFFKEDEATNSLEEEINEKNIGGFLIVLLTSMSIYQSYLIFVLVKIFFFK